MFAAVVVAALVAHAVRTRTPPPVPVRLTAALLAFVAFAALSATWSVAPGQSLSAVAPVAAMLLGGAVLMGLAANMDEPGRAAVRAAAIGGGAFGGALVLGEWMFDRSILGAYQTAVGQPMLVPTQLFITFKPMASVLALFAWPLLLAVRHRFSRAAALAAGAVLLALFVALKATTPLYAFVIGGAVFFLARRIGRIIVPLLGTALVVGVLAAPWIAVWLPNPEWESRKVGFLSNSAFHRLEIWRTVAAHIQGKTWAGHGFDTARRLYPQGTEVVKTFRRDDPEKTYSNKFEPIPLHPHNMILQIWLETGLAGALLVLAALGAVLAALARATLDKTEKAAGYAFFITALAIGSVSFGAWQAWWLSTILLNAALMIAVFSRSPISRNPS
ncbi:MAG: O-antigen ligase family protein [Pseudomonadota bacterium]